MKNLCCPFSAGFASALWRHRRERPYSSINSISNTAAALNRSAQAMADGHLCRCRHGRPFNVVTLTLDAGGLSGKDSSPPGFSTRSSTIYFTSNINRRPAPGPPALPYRSKAMRSTPVGLPASISNSIFRPQIPNGARFEADELVVYTMEGIGLSAADFDFMNSGGEGLYSAAHVQSIPADPGADGSEAAPRPPPCRNRSPCCCSESGCWASGSGGEPTGVEPSARSWIGPVEVHTGFLIPFRFLYAIESFLPLLRKA